MELEEENKSQIFMQRLFSNVKIIDLTRVFSGPFATRHFADQGAEVVKIEWYSSYDDSRKFPPRKNEQSGYFELLNRNKKSIILHLKIAEDRAFFLDLCKDADVVVENFSPSVKEKLQVSYADIKKVNPDIIYASLSGIGPKDDRPYYDIIAQAESGLVSLSGTNARPMKIGPAVVDAFSGMKLAYAISSALYYRQQTGKGQHLFVSMLGSAFDLLEQNLIEYSITKQLPKRMGNIDNAIAPFGLYHAKDGLIALAIGNDKLWKQFVLFLKKHNVKVSSDFQTVAGRLKHNVRLKKMIERLFRQFDKKQLVKNLHKHGIPSGPVNTMKDIYEQKSLYKNNLLRKKKHPQLGSIVSSTGGIGFFSEFGMDDAHAPKLGEHDADYKTASTVRISPLAKKHIPGLRKFLELVYKKSVSNKYVQWKYRTVGSLKPIAYIVRMKDAIVSFYINTPVRLHVRGKTISAYLCTDIATQKEYRGKGLISVLQKKVYDDVQKTKAPFTLGFSNKSGILLDKHAKDYTYHIVGKFIQYDRVLETSTTSEYACTQIKKLPKATFVTDKNSFARDTVYLEWRYRQKPGSTYRMYEISDGDDIIGYTVLAKRKNVCVVFDILTSDDARFEQILLAIEVEAKSLGCRHVRHHVLDNSFWRGQLEDRYSIKKSRESYALTIRSNNNALLGELAEADSWFLTAGAIV